MRRLFRWFQRPKHWQPADAWAKFRGLGPLQPAWRKEPVLDSATLVLTLRKQEKRAA